MKTHFTGIQKVLEYVNLEDEIKSFEETYDVEFPEDLDSAEQIKFIKEVEDEDSLIDLGETNSRHILYHLILAEMEFKAINELFKIN